jgi:hypothetical protein
MESAKYFGRNITPTEAMMTLSRMISEQVKHLIESAQRWCPWSDELRLA